MNTPVIFHVPSRLIDNKVKVALIGAGGTGSEMLDGLVRLHHGLVGVGHPCGLHVTVYDGDEVSPSNIGRQRFWSADIGYNKAALSIQRINLFGGLDWSAIPEYLDQSGFDDAFIETDIVITCVDKASFRVDLGKHFSDSDHSALWLDCGNGQHTAQVILGHISRHPEISNSIRLPNVYDLYPDLSDVDDDATPSCSLDEAIRSQDLFVNRTTATCAGQLLWCLLRDGMIVHHGAFIDVKSMHTRPLTIDPEVWSWMGYSCDQHDNQQ